MAWCLIKKQSNKFIDKIKSGEINPDKLSNMTSKERREFFIKDFGEDNAKQINALFESKLLLKNQKAGMITWAKKTGGITEPARRDIISRINRLEKVLDPKAEQEFLEDLAASKLGVDVTQEEAQNIFKMSKNLEAKKVSIPENSPVRSTERLEYGTEKVILLKYLDELKRGAEKTSLLDYFKNPGKAIKDFAGLTKSLLATFDNSFWGRQGIKALYSNPAIWAKNFIKSWGDIGKELKGQGLFKKLEFDATDMIKSDVFSRPNALNNKYKVGGFDVGIRGEEAFPTSLPEKIPFLGRFFRASEAAFNGGALRMRADLADRYIKMAENQGKDMLNKVEAEGIGDFVNAMTGRGKISLTKSQSEVVNAMFFSIRFLKSNIDTLLLPFKKGKSTAFAQKEARKNLLKMVGGIASVLTTAEILHPGSVELDPRSSDFGKIKINDTRFDITGGMASLVTLATRITPSLHDGEWGFWMKSTTTGKYTKLNDAKFGQRNALDVFEDFFTNKLSPLAGMVRDIWKGKNFQDEKPTPLNVVKNLSTPISIQTFQELLDNPNSAPLIRSIILEGIGVSPQTYSQKKKKIKSIK